MRVTPALPLSWPKPSSRIGNRIGTRRSLRPKRRAKSRTPDRGRAAPTRTSTAAIDRGARGSPRAAPAHSRDPLRRKDALRFRGYYRPRTRSRMQNRVGLLASFIYAVSCPVGGHKMLSGSEQPTEPGRRQAAALQQTLNRLSVLMSTVELPQSFGIAIAIDGSRGRATGTAAVRGHGGETNGGRMARASPLLRRDVSAANLFLGHRC